MVASCLRENTSSKLRRKPSSDELLDDFTAELGELLEPTDVEERELVIIQPEQAQKRDVEIADVVHAVHGFGAGLVGRDEGVAGFHDATRHPERHGLRIVNA